MAQMAPLEVLDKSSVYASLDGDADRVLFFHFIKEKFTLLDGDRIASLFAFFIKSSLEKIGVSVSLGVVQTAYSNGSFSNFIQNKLNLELVTVSTGVKHLHHAAKQFEIGIYFEANGHGTVLLSDATIELLNEKRRNGNIQEIEWSKILLAFSGVVNQTVGDGVADLLAVVACLSILKWSFDDWSNLYLDLPNKQAKVKVCRKSDFKTTNADTTLIEPAGLQMQINEITRKVESGRCFVRPSGTEDCVRVYAEASSSAEVDLLIDHVSNLLKINYS